MKMPVTFAVVLFLHVFVLSLLLVQPGCNSKDKPKNTTESTQMKNAYQQDSSRAQMQRGVDSEFNAGLAATSEPIPLNGEMAPAPTRGGELRAAPTRPTWEFNQEAGQVVAGDPIQQTGMIQPIDPAGGMMQPVQGAQMDSYTVKKGDTLWGISRRYDVSLSELLEINGMTKQSVLRPGQIISIPMSGGSEAISAGQTNQNVQGVSAAVSGREYIVQRGDTLSGIASRNGISVSGLKAANNFSSDMIRVGQTLLIPDASNAPAVTNQSQNKPARKGYYRIRPGDTLTGIARSNGVTLQQLMEWNGIQNPRTIRAGQELRITKPANFNNSAVRTPEPALKPMNQAPVLQQPSEPTDLESLEDIPETTIKPAQ